jgi:hypothetical protein
MSVATPVDETLQHRASPARDVVPSLVRASDIGVSIGLFGMALALRLWAIAQVQFPLTEGSAYYVAVARNLVDGRGLEIDAIWSYATPPLALPRPAFELWQPLASLIAAAPMTLLGSSFATAQLAFAALGALLAPLAWLVARDAARRLGLPARREWATSVGAGLLVASSGPLLLTSAIPDSTLPFTVLAVTACVLMPSAAAGRRPALVALGVVLGLAYLTRMEAIYLGLAFVVMALLTRVGVRRVVAMAAGVAGIGALVALPWWLRNLAVFGSPMPGQVADNILLVRNEQIFSYADRPTLEAFLAQGVPELLARVAVAASHDLVNVLLIPIGPIAVIGLASIVVGLWRLGRPGAHDVGDPVTRGSLAALFLAGALTYSATSVLFPVATLWGTFEHAAGALVVGLIVAAALGADAAVARVREWRAWPRSNAWLAPAALLFVSLPLAVAQITAAGTQATARQAQIDALAHLLPAALAAAGVDENAPLIGDRPIWLSEALGRPVIVLPDEPPADVYRLAADFGARAVVVAEARGMHPAAFRAAGIPAAECFAELTPSGLPPGSVVFVVAEKCTWANR